SNVSDDAHDLRWHDGGGHGDRHALADGILIREVLPYQGFVDDHDVRAFVHLAFREPATALERDVHRLEVPLVADPNVGDVGLARRRYRPADDGEAGRGA